MRIKYPRTFHCPWSLSATADDKTWDEVDFRVAFSDLEVVVTEKLDGENTTIYPDGYTHARSLSSVNHPSRSWVKKLASRVGIDIPKGWRVCGENVYARHSISYNRLGSYFYVFAIFDEHNTMLSWDDMVEWADLLDLDVVPLLYRGPFHEEAIKAAWDGRSAFGDTSEGYVIRDANAIPYEDFNRKVAKFVRANHVQTDTHWMFSNITPNRMA